MSESALVRDLAVVMVTSGIVTALFHRLHQPVVLGYILAGVIIGPHTPPFAFVHDAHSIETLAELGVILLLLSIGLEFSLRKLRRVGGVALAGAAFEIPVMVWLGFSAGRLAGWGTTESVFLGAILSISSTTIIAKALAELRQNREEYARIVMGILIVEDLGAIVMLVLLSSLASAGEVAIGQAVLALGAVTLFVVATTVIGLLLVPRLLATVGRISTPEVLTIVVLALCFGSAIVARGLGFSTALGAFLAGAVMAETRQVHQIEERIESIRDMFSAIFFVAVGMQIDPRVIVAHAPLVAGLVLVTVAGKVFACSAATVACGYPPRTALRVGMALGQIGEFSFIIAALGKQAGVVPDTLYPLTVAVSAVTTLSTPYQIRGADWVATGIAPAVPARLRALVAFYHGKIRRKERRRSPLSRGAWQALVRGFVSTTLVVALLFVADLVRQFAAQSGARSLVFPHDVEVLLWSACGLASLPALAGVWRAGGLLAKALLGPLADGSSGRILVEIVRFAFLVAGGAVFLALASPILPVGVPLVVAATVVSVAAVLFWRSVGAVHARAETLLQTVLSGTEVSASSAARDELVELVSTRYPFDVVVEDFLLPFHDTACNRSIRDLALRQRTGATIAAVFRDEASIVNPDPGLVLRPGDLLVLLGSAEQVARAMHELKALASQTIA
ncbi:MAG TPA: cation:proton antiporter [Candidatus Binatia bacterium]|nr:cation:proton antiporter [Candidatus Binatia bacterium]